MHWGSFIVGVIVGMFGVPFAQQLLAKAKTGSA